MESKDSVSLVEGTIMKGTIDLSKRRSSFAHHPFENGTNRTIGHSSPLVPKNRSLHHWPTHCSRFYCIVLRSKEKITRVT